MIRWQQIAPTPADLEDALYFCFDHPTPSQEGFVLRFSQPERNSWMGNFQRSITNYADVIDWPEASVIVIIAFGACYFVNPNEPQKYVAHSSGGVMHRPIFNNDRSMILVPDYGDVYAYNRTASLLWRREDLSDFEVRVENCSGDVVTVASEDDSTEIRQTIRLRCSDGRRLPVKRG